MEGLILKDLCAHLQTKFTNREVSVWLAARLTNQRTLRSALKGSGLGSQTKLNALFSTIDEEARLFLMESE